MQAYMKSTMRYHGVSAPSLRAICREVFARHPLASAEAWREAVLALWRDARRREERYAAIGLLGWRAYAPYRTLDLLPLLEELVLDGAWWDFVDPIATHRVRELLARYPKPMTRAMRAWSRDANFWKRRCAILCQVGRKRETDLELLYDCIEPNLADKEFSSQSRRGSTRHRSLASPPSAFSREFFVRKAIGWALRDYAWHDLVEVERYVAANESRLSGLSRREALKNRDALRAGTARGGRVAKKPPAP